MNTMFLVSMIVEAIFGLGFVLAPGALLAPMGVTLDANAATFARLFGSALISFPLLLWLARRSSNQEFRQGTVASLFAYYVVSTVLLLMAQLSGIMNALGWSVVVLHLVLTIWFGYSLIR